MPAAKYNLTIEQGTTTSFFITYKDAEGNGIPLTGCSAQLQIRSNYADLSNEKYLTLSSSLDPDGSGIIINEESGSISLYISAEKTDALKFEEGLYDLEIYVGDYVQRLMEGKVKIKKSVTR